MNAKLFKALTIVVALTFNKFPHLTYIHMCMMEFGLIELATLNWNVPTNFPVLFHLTHKLQYLTK